MQDYWLLERTIDGDPAPKQEWFPVPERYYPKLHPSEADADYAVSAILQWSGTELTPRKVKPEEWQAVANYRYDTGEWEPVCWVGRGWMTPEFIQDHFPHVSKTDPTKVAFIEDDAKGQADRITVMKPGRFLTKYFSDVLSPEAIGDLANVYIARSQPGELKFARTADEIEHVYTNGPSSCMSHSADNYESSCHPARVYASPDLAVAYILRGDITARAVVWPDKKQYSRVYGDEERLVNALQAKGYSYGDLEGARLVRIENYGAFVCPYLDRIGTVRDDGEFLIIDSEGDIDARETEGLTADNSVECDHCGDRCDPDDTYRVEVSRWSGENWCESCQENHATYCEAEGEYVDDDSTVLLADGTVVSEWYFADNDGFTCEGTNEAYLGGDIVVLEDGTCWSTNYFSEHGFTCADTGGNYSRNDGHELPSGEWVCDEAWEAREAEEPGLDLQVA